MTLLTFNSKFVITSAVAVSTTSSTPVDDTQASKTFTLTATQTVLAIYQAHNNFNSIEEPNGKGILINIDGTQTLVQVNSPFSRNYPNGNTTFWIGTLASGTHTIKGQFRADLAATTVTINERVLLIYILNGNEFSYINDSTLVSTTSGTFVNDTPASITFTPSGDCKALIMYSTTSFDQTEDSAGTKIAINNLTTDLSQSEKSGHAINQSVNVFTLHFASLTAVSNTVNGRFASNASPNTVSIQNRQFGVLLFGNSTLADYITSDIQVTTSTTYPVNDTQATITRTTIDTRELLVVAMGTVRTGSHFTNIAGVAYGIKNDANDRVKSRNSPFDSLSALSSSTAYAEQLASGAHTVQGRFGRNNGAGSTIIDSRRIVALWLTISTSGQSIKKSMTTKSSMSSNTKSMILSRSHMK